MQNNIKGELPIVNYSLFYRITYSIIFHAMFLKIYGLIFMVDLVSKWSSIPLFFHHYILSMYMGLVRWLEL